jgi:hypothetical protein
MPQKTITEMTETGKKLHKVIEIVSATEFMKPPTVSDEPHITNPVKGKIYDVPSAVVKPSEEKAVPKKLVNPFEQ